MTLSGDDLYLRERHGGRRRALGSEAARHGPVRLALLPISAHHYSGPATDDHIGANDAVTALGQRGAEHARHSLRYVRADE